MYACMKHFSQLSIIIGLVYLALLQCISSIAFFAIQCFLLLFLLHDIIAIKLLGLISTKQGTSSQLEKYQ